MSTPRSVVRSISDIFRIVRNGLQPYAPAGYESDMPAFGGNLSDDEIWAVLAFIKNSWPEEIQERQRAITVQTSRAER